MSRRVRWTIGILLVTLLIGCIWPACQMFVVARNAARLDVSRHKLKQIGLALHAYHDMYKCFPPAYVRGPDDKPWHSWRVLLLPFMNEQKLYDRYHFDEPWDGPHNRKLQLLRPDAYASLLQESKHNNVTTFLGVVSRRTMWPAHSCVRREDVTDGEFNTVMLLENLGSDVIWSEPREMREKEALALFNPADVAKTPESQAITTLLVDGSVRRFWTSTNRQHFFSFLTPKYGEYTASEEGWLTEERSRPITSEVLDISKYPGTVVMPTTDVPLMANQSNLYCATTQLAWDALRPGNDQPVDFLGRSPTAEALNAHLFPKDSLDKQAYFVSSARLDDDSYVAMSDAFRERFPSAPQQVLKANSNEMAGLHVLAYLEKSMPFPDVLERFTNPLSFGGTDVQSFGSVADVGKDGWLTVLERTVEVCDYTSDQDFIVLLKTDSSQKDEIILARVEASATLRDTWNAVSDRMQQPKGAEVVRGLRAIDQLQIPILSFCVKASLNELSELRIPTALVPDRYIVSAEQTIRFRLDEYGAELIADTQFVIGEGDPSDILNSIKPRHFIFNRPFLIVLREKGAAVPYFLAWIGNADLMELMKTP